MTNMMAMPVGIKNHANILLLNQWTLAQDSWNVSKIFVPGDSNDDLGLTLSFSMARSKLLYGLLYEMSS